MTVVTRFPPSPTGLMHIGTARTLLYNWLYARGRGGKVVFRIEDTDRERYDPAHVDALVNGVKWLELDYDGEVVSQYERRARHAEVAQELLNAGKAYHCYCSAEELDAMREKAKAEGRPTFYDRRWRDSTATPPEGVKPVIRIKAPLDGQTTLHDQVQGDVTLNNEQLDDMIILRSDGTPVYMLAVVVDDHDMGVTHVIRGDDHLNNTFRQNLIYDAMGWQQPTYGHLPLILNENGAKMSKRHGAASVEEYRDMGYLPEAMRNYLLRLGWSHGDDEIISDAQALEWFDLDHVVRSPARWDFDKLNHLNALYIKQADNARLIDLLKDFSKLPITDEGKRRLSDGMDELKARATTLVSLAEEARIYLQDAPFAFDEKAQKLLDDDAKATLADIAAQLNALSNFTPENIEEVCRAYAKEKKDGKLGKVMMPVRAALSGTDKSPSLFHVAAIIGKDETIKRLNAAL